MKKNIVNVNGENVVILDVEIKDIKKGVKEGWLFSANYEERLCVGAVAGLFCADRHNGQAYIGRGARFLPKFMQEAFFWHEAGHLQDKRLTINGGDMYVDITAHLQKEVHTAEAFADDYAVSKVGAANMADALWLLSLFPGGGGKDMKSRIERLGVKPSLSRIIRRCLLK